MNWNVVEGNWKQYVGSVKTQWGKLTDDHIATIAGRREHLAGKIQEAYGVGIDEAEKQIKAFESLYKI
ncbi:MAG: CsbD family protein [Burkholderiaceae bacterium]